MKNLLLLLFIVLFATSCYKDHSDLIPGQDFIPQEVLDKIRENGQPIYEGLNPPKVEGKYNISPIVLVNSNFEDGAQPGHTFADELVEFYNYNPTTLTLEASLEHGTSVGQGFGSFITGSGNKFTIFVKVESTDEHGHKSTETRIYSGTMEESGIRDLYLSFFMIDDFGDPDNEWIEIGQGRLFKDNDGFSEKQ